VGCEFQDVAFKALAILRSRQARLLRLDSVKNVFKVAGVDLDKGGNNCGSLRSCSADHGDRCRVIEGVAQFCVK